MKSNLFSAPVYERITRFKKNPGTAGFDLTAITGVVTFKYWGSTLTSAGVFFIEAYQVGYFFFAIRLPVGPQYIMKPKLRLRFVRFLPQIPGNMCLRFTGYKAPAISTNIQKSFTISTNPISFVRAKKP